MVWQTISTTLTVITSGGRQPFHEPQWTVEGTTGIQSAATLPIPEGITWVEYMLASTFAGSITEVVIPHKGWDWERDWVVNVGAGTKVLGIDCDYLMKSSCKSPDLFPGITSMSEGNTTHIVVINSDMAIIIIGPKCIWWSLLVACYLATHRCISYTMKVEDGRGAPTFTNVHYTESL